ncbi:tryptophan--tRNA ligase [Mycoplasma sp. CAG:776]|nr:tryptophan--tRNA ligase [Mycoplasma sp. CAG:776]
MKEFDPKITKSILTGIQPSGVITLGNYIGAIRQMVRMQDLFKSYIFIADMHAITVPQDAKVLHENIRSLVALYLACGIDPDKNIIFIQSENEYHANISWLLECNTPFGELSRMTQFKDKSSKNANFYAGLFTYPVLMAADILAYDVDYVPVGIDQKQHVELARNIALRFNKKYGDTFKLPEAFITEAGTKIMDLVTPDKKMSKSSDNPKGVIRLLDDVVSIRKKIMSATTDSDCLVKYDPQNKPGISNLINICVSITGSSIQEIEEKFVGKNYGEFKKYVADVVIEEISGIQKRYEEIINSDRLDQILDENIKITREIAKNKFMDMKKKMGLYK